MTRLGVVVGPALHELGTFLSGPPTGMEIRPDEPVERPPDLRGPAYVVVQVTALALLVALVLIVLMLLNGTSGGPLVWPLTAIPLVLPAVLHAAARPARRASGMATGLVVALVVVAVAWALGAFVTASFWPGFVAVAVAMVAGSAVFAAVSSCSDTPGGTAGP